MLASCISLPLCTSDIFQALKNNQKKAITSWLKSIKTRSATDLEQTNAKKETILIQAVKMNNKRVVKALLKKNIAVNTKDSTGKTALDYAVEQKHGSLVKPLLKHGAYVTTKENDSACKKILKKRMIAHIGIAAATILIVSTGGLLLLGYVALIQCTATIARISACGIPAR